MQLRCMPCVVLGHHLGNARQRHPPHAFLMPRTLAVARILQRRHVLQPRLFEPHQRRLQFELQILPLRRNQVAAKIRQLRVMLSLNPPYPLPIPLHLQIRQMPRLLHRGEQPIRPTHAQPLRRHTRDELAKVLREGAKVLEHA